MRCWLVIAGLVWCSGALAAPPRAGIDEAQTRRAGIRKLEGKHLRLFTDLPSSPEVDVLPEVFDQAFPQWCRYFALDEAAHADWRVTGYLIKDKPLFQRLGLLPDGLPPFLNGYSRGAEFWVYDQPSDYYRRHLLLHEGTHCVMSLLVGGSGPPWLSEGLAELLGTHRWHEGTLTLGVIPQRREDVPMWGRIKIVADGFAARRAKTLRQVIDYDTHAHRETEPYGWCWAAALLLDRNPHYRDRFRRLARMAGRHADLNAEFFRLFPDFAQAAEEWQVLVSSLEYGHDLERTAIDFAPGQRLPSEGRSVRIAADRGWQNSGLRLDGGRTYQIRARGRYQLAGMPQVWWCEPNGVSIRYYQGRPLGVLLCAVHPDEEVQGVSPLLRPTVCGLGRTVVPEVSGTLMLKINESAAELGDNSGSLDVTVTPAAGPS